jgi:hypothetical protein
MIIRIPHTCGRRRDVIRHLLLLTAAISALLLPSILSEVRLCGAQTPSDQKKVVFHWAMGAGRNTAEGGSKFESITANTTLNSGDRVKFYIKPITKCFIYLICRNSQGNLLLLFPYRLNETPIGEQFSKGYLIPEGAQWFEFDEHTGKETFILLSSLERLARLEVLITSYETAPNDRKTELGSQILSEIDSLRGKNSKLKSFAERPLSIIGQVRGAARPESVSTIDLADYAVEISADTFYSRTFTIDHR